MPGDSFLSKKKSPTPTHSRFKGLEPHKFAIPNSSTQQIKFRLSGFEEMPSFDKSPISAGAGEYSSASSRSGLRTSSVPTMPKPGRSIPKFGVDEVAAAIEKTLPPPPPTPASISNNRKLGKSRGSLLERFDNAVSNASATAHNRGAVMRDKLKTEASRQIKSKFGGSASRLEDPVIARELDSVQKIGAKMDNIMKTWMPGEEIDKRSARRNSFGGLHKDQSRIKPERKPMLPPRGLGKGSSSRHSDSKLKVISDGFRATLNPFASQDPRELIRTPSDEIVDHLNQRHMDSLHKKESETKKSYPLKAPRGKGRTNMDGPTSSDYQGLMDFRTLLEKQSEHQKRLNNPGGKLSDQTEYGDAHNNISHPPAMIPGSEIVSSLTESTKNMDAAASIAQRLGSLMSRVASQRASYNNANTTSSNTSVPSARSRFLPVDELERRASILKGVAQEAHRSLQDIELHSVGVGGESPGRSSGSILSSTWSKNAADGNNSNKGNLKSVRGTKSGQTDRGISTQTEKAFDHSAKPSSSAKDFEFVKDMSYTDQLMLKKLRGMKASWTEHIDAGDEELEMQAESKGTGDQVMSQKTLAAAIASSKKK